MVVSALTSKTEGGGACSIAKSNRNGNIQRSLFGIDLDTTSSK